MSISVQGRRLRVVWLCTKLCKDLSSTGKVMLTFSELEQTLLDVECFTNNRPLAYLGEKFEDRAVTPNILLRANQRNS